MRSSTRIGLLGGIASLVLAGIVQAEQSILAELEVYGLERMAKQVSAISAAAGKELPPEAVTGMLGQMLGNPAWEGIDAEGVFRVIVVGDESMMEQDAPPAALILPLAGGVEPVANGLSTFANSDGEEEGIHAFSRNDDAPMTFPEKVFLAQKSGGAILGMDKDVVRTVRDLLGEDPPGNRSLGTAVITVHMSRILEIFKPMIDAQIESMTEMMQMAQESIDADGPQMDTGAVIGAEADLFMVLMQQIKKASIGIALEDGVFRINSGFDPVENSTFAGSLAEAKPPPEVFQNILPGNSIFAQAGYLPGVETLLESYMDFLKKMYSSMGPEMEEMSDKFMGLTEKLMAEYTGNYAFGIARGESGALPSFVQILSVADTAQFHAHMDELIEIQKDIWDPDLIGYEYTVEKAGERTYKEAKIQTIKVNLHFNDEVESEIPAGLMKFLENLQYDIATMNDIVLFTFGGSNVTDSAIEGIRSGGGTPVHQHEEFKTVFPKVEGAPIDAFHVGIFDLARAVVELLPKEFKEEVPAIPEGAGTIAGYSVVKGGTLYSHGAFRDQVVTAVAGMIAGIASPAFSSARSTGREISSQQAAAAMDPCASNLRQLAVACFLYAGDHENDLPTSVDQLNDYLGSPGEGIPAVLLCPDAEDRSVPSYRIVATGKISFTNDLTTARLMEEIEAPHDGKRWVAFGDGHVEQVEK